MGSNISVPDYDPTKDKCHSLLLNYVNCVEGKKNGLKEGDECLRESQLYKKCRADEKREIIAQAQADMKAKLENAESALKGAEQLIERKSRAFKKDAGEIVDNVKKNVRA